MPTVIKAQSGQDFLALVPHLLGYRPRRSAVLIAFRGNRTCGALRFDLPAPGALKVLKRHATSMIGMLCKIRDVDALVPLVYTDARFESGDGLQGSFLDALVHRAELAGLHVRDALCVAADGWGSLFDEAVPPGGRPLRLIAESPVASVAELGDREVADDVTAGTDLPHVGLVKTERVARRMQELGPDLVRSADELCDEAEGDDMAALFEGVLRADVEALSVDLAAFALRLVQAPPLRDIALLGWAFGLETGRRVEREAVEYASTHELVETPDGLLLAGIGPRPDAERIDAAIVLLRTLGAHAPVSARPPVFAMLAWLSWALGQSSRAAVFVENALAIDPEYGLAQLVGAMVAGGRLPEWAFEPPEIDEAQVRYADVPSR
ncbi:DUF4192 domain-containing protein [Rathayibacter sp. YIM 133350]|uniref:DUF4192 domain-containing protein n=1 Tax=Rathayibacter sp. YIM 133350 TaxID=3131992 RepID=UPI00307F9FA6